MPIYADINTAFVHIPKTGGSSVANALYHANKAANGKKNGYSFEIEKHETGLDIQKYCEKHNFDKLFSFSVVRNPLDRLASWYFYYKELFENKTLPADLCPNGCGESFLKMEFNEWVRSLRREYDPTCSTEIDCPLTQMAPQTVHVSDYGGFILLDEIIRFEQLQEGWEYICSKIGLEDVSLPHLNRGREMDYKSIYDSDTEKLVRSLYKIDFDTFGY